MGNLTPSRLRRVRLVDRLVAGGITAGGSLVLLAVAFLMVFLFAQTLPLLGGGTARPQSSAPAPGAPLLALEDDFREGVIVLGADGVLQYARLDGAGRTVPLEGVQPPLREAVLDAAGRLLVIRDAADELQVWAVRVKVGWESGERRLEPTARPLLRRAGAGLDRLLAAGGDAEAPVVVAATASGAAVLRGSADAVEIRLGTPAAVAAISRDGRELWLGAARDLSLFRLDGGPAPPVLVAAVPLRRPPTAGALLLGDTTMLLGDAGGTVTAWQVVAGAVAGTRVLDRSAEFTGNGPVVALAPSPRDKTFLVRRTGGAELVHLTSRRVVLALPEFPADAVQAGFSPRRDGVFALTAARVVHRWSLAVPHPEATAGTLFLPVRYEGFTEPELVWQSTGGSGSFEPKLSLVPLVVGTFKGALYALLFSAPCALAAALYLSQFAPGRLRTVAKPAIELMAALPSVVVGFLAALLLAPVLERHVVGVLTAFVLLPLGVIAAAAAWERAPLAWRRRLRPRGELLLVGGALAATLAAVAAVAPTVERVLFAGDFRAWLLASAGVTYDQRNAVVVGFALGFAVIPIIFTLAEDAFSNVPPSLVSASLALGATRWQAARTVAIPAASPGLFAAVMTGLGRAVGETMIVLMATGNTPILSLSPFDGMRTMAASIAVELPEAAFGDTLYRVLILTALMLFAMTFVINTAAVLISARLRKRFGRLAA
jgi:phosphate transport system permease protein